MNAYQRLLKRLPKKYHNRVIGFDEEYGLIDNCKYMLSWTDEYTSGGREGIGFCFPVRSIKEAIDFIKNSLFKVEEK